MKPVRYIKFEPTPQQKLDKWLKRLLYFIIGGILGCALTGIWPTGRLFGQPLSRNQACFTTSEQRGFSETLFVRAIIASESSFNPKARSRAGARGLMQLMPSTARYVHQALFGEPLLPAQLEDPYVNVALGTSYLLEMIYKFRDIDLALAAYNGGPGAVKRGFRARQYVKKINKLAENP